MRIDEIYNSQDRLFAKMKGLRYNFSLDASGIEKYCNENYIPGNLQSANDCKSMIDDLVSEIDNLLNNHFEDDLLVLFQQDASKIKDRMLDLRNKL